VPWPGRCASSATSYVVSSVGAEDPNAGQAEYWNAACHWVDEQIEHDEMLEPLGRLAMDALAPASGERVLDVGCGTGTTTFALAEAVGPDGEAVGADISVPMLERARSRVGPPNASFLEADAQTHPFSVASFDGAFSRFGVMFFADPAAAFANIASALRPEGRLAFVCWQGAEEQEWVRVPLRAVGVVPEAPDGPSPFALADAGRLTKLLDEAGFVRVDIAPAERTVLVGGHGDIENGLRFLTSSRIGRQIAEERGAEAMARVREALEGFVTARGVEMRAAVWVVTAATARTATAGH